MSNRQSSSDNLSDTEEEPVSDHEATPAAHSPHRGIYLLPNMFTTSALFAGFYAIIASINGNFVASAVAIFVAMVLDTLDGRIARMTGTQSNFGAEYDSLSDVIAFGLAPALVAFLWSLNDLGKIGWICSFIYVAGTALRLARFNTQLETADKRFFTGLASPSAAALIAGTVWAMTEWGVEGAAFSIPFAAVVAGAGLLMVSNFKYYSFKVIGHKKKVPFLSIVAVVFVFALVAVEPATVLVSFALAYALSGPAWSCWSWLRRRRKQKEN